MKKSLFAVVSLVAGLASVAACAASAAAQSFAVCAREVATRAWRFVTVFVSDVHAGVRGLVARHLPGPAVALTAARMYVARQAKRQRPLLATRWRMCPSI